MGAHVVVLRNAPLSATAGIVDGPAVEVVRPGVAILTSARAAFALLKSPALCAVNPSTWNQRTLPGERKK